MGPAISGLPPAGVVGSALTGQFPNPPDGVPIGNVNPAGSDRPAAAWTRAPRGGRRRRTPVDALVRAGDSAPLTPARHAPTIYPLAGRGPGPSDLSGTGSIRRMSRRYVNQLSHGDSIDESYLVADKQLRANRQGNLYLQLELRDKTGSVGARLWNATEELSRSFEPGDYLRVRGKTQVFQGSLQIILTHIDVLDPNRVEAEDFLPQSSQNVAKLMARLREVLLAMNNPHLRALVECFLIDDDFVRKFTSAPAGIKNHHAYQGGLLEHVVALLNVADRIVDLYPEIDRDLLLTGIFLHDIGKIDELSYDRAFAYTDEGQLVGHLVMGVEMLRERVERTTRPDRRVVPARAAAPAQAHDRQPPRHLRVRQSEAADDPRGRRASLPGQSRRQDSHVQPRDPRRPQSRLELDAVPAEPGSKALQGGPRRGGHRERHCRRLNFDDPTGGKARVLRRVGANRQFPIQQSRRSWWVAPTLQIRPFLTPCRVVLDEGWTA